MHFLINLLYLLEKHIYILSSLVSELYFNYVRTQIQQKYKSFGVVFNNTRSHMLLHVIVLVEFYVKMLMRINTNTTLFSFMME